MTARATVLAYHGVGDPPPGADVHGLFVAPARFAAQMRFLARHRQVLPLHVLVRGEAPAGKPAVALTFDDGYRHLLDTAVPVLEQHGFPSTVFVPSRWIGDRNTWDAPSACDLAIMDEEQLLEAERRGMSVESHGHAHLDMRVAADDDVATDLEQSRRLLGEVTGRTPAYLAWPYRDGSPSAQQIARAVGFDAAFSIDQPGTGPHSRERVQITPGDGAALFALKTSGHYTRLRHSPALFAAYRAVRRVSRR